VLKTHFFFLEKRKPVLKEKKHLLSPLQVLAGSWGGAPLKERWLVKLPFKPFFKKSVYGKKTPKFL